MTEKNAYGVPCSHCPNRPMVKGKPSIRHDSWVCSFYPRCYKPKRMRGSVDKGTEKVKP